MTFADRRRHRRRRRRRKEQVFFDRGVTELVGYVLLMGSPCSACRPGRDPLPLAPPVAAYTRYGYEPVPIPRTAVAARARFVLGGLRPATGGTYR